MSTFKMTNGKHTIETNDFLKNIWEREGYEIVEESEQEEHDDGISFSELRTMAKEAGINTKGMKKDEIIQALGL